MSAENKAIVRRVFEEGWTKGDLTAFDETIAAHYVNHDPSSLPNVTPSLEGLKQLVVAYRAAIPDLRITIEDLIEDHDKIVVRYTVTGTHMGDLMGVAPTNSKVTATGISIYLLESGKIVEGWTIWDALSLMQLDLWEVSETLVLMQQLGPPVPVAPAAR